MHCLDTTILSSVFRNISSVKSYLTKIFRTVSLAPPSPFTPGFQKYARFLFDPKMLNSTFDQSQAFSILSLFHCRRLHVIQSTRCWVCNIYKYMFLSVFISDSYNVGNLYKARVLLHFLFQQYRNELPSRLGHTRGGKTERVLPPRLPFSLSVHYSTLLHLPPLRFNFVGGCWELRLQHGQSDALTTRLDLIHNVAG